MTEVGGRQGVEGAEQVVAEARGPSPRPCAPPRRARPAPPAPASRQPASASRLAATRPFGPAPTTMASQAPVVMPGGRCAARWPASSSRRARSSRRRRATRCRPELGGDRVAASHARCRRLGHLDPGAGVLGRDPELDRGAAERPQPPARPSGGAGRRARPGLWSRIVTGAEADGVVEAAAHLGPPGVEPADAAAAHHHAVVGAGVAEDQATASGATRMTRLEVAPPSTPITGLRPLG